MPRATMAPAECQQPGAGEPSLQHFPELRGQQQHLAPALLAIFILLSLNLQCQKAGVLQRTFSALPCFPASPCSA